MYWGWGSCSCMHEWETGGYLLDEISGKNENASLEFLNGILDAHVLGRSAHVYMEGGKSVLLILCEFVNKSL